MKRFILAGLAGLFFPACSYAVSAENQIALNLDDVVVTASRVPQPREAVLADVTVVDEEEIRRAGQSSLVELLQRQPGIEISSNGGPGTTSNVFLRGSNADHVVVLIDGLRINSATLGTTSFENLPLGLIERIEILRGPASSLYGADAIGGVIQIFTKRAEKGIHSSAFLGYGSYNSKRVEASVNGGSESTQFSVNASGFKTDGFSAQDISTGFDADDDPYHNLGLTTTLTHKLAEGHTLEAQFFQSKGNSHYDCNQATCEIDQTLRSYGLTSHNRFLPFWNSTLRLGIGVDESTNHTGTTNSDFHTDQRQAVWQNDFTLPLGTLTVAYERLEQEVSGSVNYAVRTRRNNGWLASYLADIGAHSVQASLRYDANSQYGDHTTGGLGYGYHITPQWRATASFGTAFKAPSFNQLYFPNFGDPALQPETSRNSEFAVRYDNLTTVKAGLTIFDNQIKNLIEFSGPMTAGCTFAGFCPVNIGKAEIRGVTFDGSWAINEQWSVGANLTVQSPRNEALDTLLIRRGQRHGTVSLDWHEGRFQVGAEAVATSLRYNNAANTKQLDGYALVNLTASYAFHPDWNLEARANNIFDKDYVLAFTGNGIASPAYQTPGANIFVGIRWQPQ